MSRWNTAITTQGQALLAGLDGKTLKLTAVKCSKGKTTGNLESLTSLTDYVMDLSISQSASSGSTTKMRFHLSNANVTARFSLYQIGLYAKTFLGAIDPDPNNIGILFQVWQTELADVIYTAAESPNGERDYVATSDVGNASTVIVNTDPAGSVPWDAFNDHVNDISNPHRVTAAQVGANNLNLLINGDFKVNQRGLETTTATNNYWLDRWAFYQSTHHAIITSSRVSIYDGSQGVYQTVTSVSAQDDTCAFLQFIEDLPNGYSPLAGKTITFSIFTSGDQNFRCLEVGYTDSGGTYHATYQPIPVDTNGGRRSITITVPVNVHRLIVYVSSSRIIVSSDVNTHIFLWNAKLEIGSVVMVY